MKAHTKEWIKSKVGIASTQIAMLLVGVTPGPTRFAVRDTVDGIIDDAITRLDGSERKDIQDPNPNATWRYEPPTRFNPRKRTSADGSKSQQSNGTRADNAERTVGFHQGNESEADSREGVIDLLCDLMHLCDREHIDFNEALSTAAMNHNTEA